MNLINFATAGAIVSSFVLSGCLKTRNEVRGNEQTQVMQSQVVNLQKTSADITSRFSEIEEQMRDLNGRIDVVEHKMGKNDAGVESSLKSTQQSNRELLQKVALLQEAMSKLESDLTSLNSEVESLKADKSSGAEEKSAKKSKKDAYEIGKESFDKKDWKQSILNFQKYRDENPKGSHFAEATYKIGVSFQELGMKDEAKTFYDEIISKYPKSEDARRAKVRLKGLK